MTFAALITLSLLLILLIGRQEIAEIIAATLSRLRK